MPRPLRYLWAGPVSCLGLAGALAARSTGGVVAVHTGVLEASGGALTRWLPRIGLGMRPAAITLGHVVLAVDADTMARWRSHERVHVAQTERWGPFFPFAYAVASLAARARGGDPYQDNVFEREARLRSG